MILKFSDTLSRDDWGSISLLLESRQVWDNFNQQSKQNWCCVVSEIWWLEHSHLNLWALIYTTWLPYGYHALRKPTHMEAKWGLQGTWLACASLVEKPNLWVSKPEISSPWPLSHPQPSGLTSWSLHMS